MSGVIEAGILVQRLLLDGLEQDTVAGLTLDGRFHYASNNFLVWAGAINIIVVIINVFCGQTCLWISPFRIIEVGALPRQILVFVFALYLELWMECTRAIWIIILAATQIIVVIRSASQYFYVVTDDWHLWWWAGRLGTQHLDILLANGSRGHEVVIFGQICALSLLLHPELVQLLHLLLPMLVGDWHGLHVLAVHGNLGRVLTGDIGNVGRAFSRLCRWRTLFLLASALYWCLSSLYLLLCDARWLLRSQVTSSALVLDVLDLFLLHFQVRSRALPLGHLVRTCLTTTLDEYLLKRFYLLLA